MPLPDADKKSPRVYTLLQNLDLENLSADDLANVADPIAIEEANEDELRRLCLVAFARMVTKGSFDGWLSAGGYPVKSPLDSYGDDVWSNLSNTVPYSVGMGGNFNTINPSNAPQAIPFIAPHTGTVNEIGTYVQTGAGTTDNFIMAIYENDTTDNAPGTLLGYGEIDMTSSGAITTTSITGTIALSAGTLYWLVYARSTASTSSARCRYVSANDRAGLGWGAAVNQTNCSIDYGGVDWTSDAVVDGVGTITEFDASAVCSIGVKYA
jgi:hypothetical protein